jgi:homogentisate 1,2-dioxygenase
MFESRAVIAPTRLAMETAARQRDYDACWAGLKKAELPKAALPPR